MTCLCRLLQSSSCFWLFLHPNQSKARHFYPYLHGKGHEHEILMRMSPKYFEVDVCTHIHISQNLWHWKNLLQSSNWHYLHLMWGFHKITVVQKRFSKHFTSLRIKVSKTKHYDLPPTKSTDFIVFFTLVISTSTEDAFFPSLSATATRQCQEHTLSWELHQNFRRWWKVHWPTCVPSLMQVAAWFATVVGVSPLAFPLSSHRKTWIR